MYKKALALDYTKAEIHLNLGFAYDSQGYHEKAVHSYIKVIELQPDYPSICRFDWQYHKAYLARSKLSLYLM